jgi:hypothetical protein
MMTIPVGALVDEVLRLGHLWLEDGRVMVDLPRQARWLLEELKRRREEVIAYCRDRWLRPGVPYKEWMQLQNGNGALRH